MHIYLPHYSNLKGIDFGGGFSPKMDFGGLNELQNSHFMAVKVVLETHWTSNALVEKMLVKFFQKCVWKVRL